jgi:TRAP-type C4-dicarboxylate transport system substrate-binding protein
MTETAQLTAHRERKESAMKRPLRWTHIFVIPLLAIGIILMSTSGAVAEPIKLTYVSFVPVASKFHFQQFKEHFIDKVNEKAKGKLEIVVKGGPETIKPYDLGVSVQRGVIDMANIPTSFYETLVPGADATKISDHSAIEERENSAYEMIAGMYEKAGFHYMGRGEATDSGFFFLFSNKITDDKEDFKGIKLGGSTAFHGFYKNLGASVSTVPLPEYHSALERKIVDGIITSLSVGMQFGLHEVSKAIVAPGVYRSNVASLMNLKTWNSLPEDMQALLTDCMVDFEEYFMEYERDFRKAALEKAEASGVNIIRLDEDVADWYVSLAEESAWTYERERFSNELIEKIKAKLTK